MTMQVLLKLCQGQRAVCPILNLSTKSLIRNKVWKASSVPSTRNIASKMQEHFLTTNFGRSPLHSRSIVCLVQQRLLSISREVTSKVGDMVSGEEDDPEFKAFYRLPSIVQLKILSRIKIVQTGLTLALIPPIYYYHDAGMLMTWQLQFSVGIATFALFMLYAMSFFLRRMIGAMYLHREGDIIKVSHLTFWGGRRDTVFPVMDVIPLSEGSNRADDVLLKLERYSTKDILYFTLPIGRVINAEAFESVFGQP
nr:transmembrane protein 186-like [Lytechinus pictus]